ncbi:hypothetical protein ACFWMQ_19285 [Streptomyces sp. NPDC058372]|uniref:hypothetical protein n=1 Tax=Streptomyces sp. NPDC058372 TaxID=3346464 RepID=UPI003651E13E
MAFSHRVATLAAVVAIPLVIAVTSFALTDSPEPPAAPPRVEMDSGSASPGRSAPPESGDPAPAASESGRGDDGEPSARLSGSPSASTPDDTGDDDADDRDGKDDTGDDDRDDRDGDDG